MVSKLGGLKLPQKSSAKSSNRLGLGQPSNASSIDYLTAKSNEKNEKKLREVMEKKVQQMQVNFDRQVRD